MRLANESVRRARHPIPTIAEVLQDFNQSKIFSKLDIKWAYHQEELSEDARDITTFITHKGLYRYKRLMFGISCAPEMYQKVLQQLLQNCDRAHNILDDIIVHAATDEEHDKRLRQVLDVIRDRGMKLNPDMCLFKMKKLEFMGHVLSDQGIGPTETKIKAVQEARAPESASEFISEQFKTFMQVNGIQHGTTTPLWPQANGEVERQNRSILKRIKIVQAEGGDWKSELDHYLIMYWSTPHSTTGRSPAELMYKRIIRTKIPQIQDYQKEDSEVRDRDNEKKGKEYADQRRRACER
ncbi:uncharacterized protein K02A2.6-like [Haliotis rubra]|uniref:uncharacterized protein K02A2.6-like n=1 Tax=Haliotis rubra TaxID=36100 RepID=UPI001EE5E22E|nr:uncharacterized protein K02A2.6-like [Haliotis rubra]